MVVLMEVGELGRGGGGVDGGAGGCDIDVPHAHGMQPKTDVSSVAHKPNVPYCFVSLRIFW